MDAPTSTTTTTAVLPVTALVPFGTTDALKQLKPLFTAEQNRARALFRTRGWSVEGMAGREAAVRRVAWYAHRAQLREEGQEVDAHLGTPQSRTRPGAWC